MKKGFTLIELMVTISIIGILFTIGMAGYTRFNRSQTLVQAALELRNDLRLAQDKALVGEKPSGWCTGEDENMEGYRLVFAGDGQSYSIRPRCSDESDGDSVKDVVLPSTVSGPSGTSALFKVLGQGAEAAASFTLTSIFSGIDSESVTITEEGQIEWQE